jgi:glycosyltransferase involved in cell wall biosynthesis
MSALEAMACARPVIATRRGALPELVRDGETGRVIPPGDVAALSEAIVAYATAPGLRVRHGESGRRRVEEHFHIDDCARAYLACLDGRL